MHLKKRKIKPPASAACLFAKSTRRQWRNKSSGKKATRMREGIFMDKLISQLPGTIAQMMGILTKKRIQVCHCLCGSILQSWTSLSPKDSNCWRDNNGKEGIWGFLRPSWSQDIGTSWQQQPFALRMVNDALKESSNLRDKQGWSQLQIFSNTMVQPNQNIGFYCNVHHIYWTIHYKQKEGSITSGNMEPRWAYI